MQTFFERNEALAFSLSAAYVNWSLKNWTTGSTS